jgi:type IV fimbrial biogenesis protein FimT
MLVVMVISALLVMTALPSFARLVASIQLTSASNVFVSGLHVARSEAIKRNGRVVLCKTADGLSCVTAGGWEQGWMIFHDANNNSLRENAEQIIHRELALPTNLRLTGNLNLSSYVSFASTGATKLASGGFQAGTLTLCRQSLTVSEARQIILNAAGRPRVQKSTLANCL